MATVEQTIALAASQIGTSGTDNKYNLWYWGQHCYDANVYPWCAVFQSWVAQQVGGLGYNPSASVSGVCNQLTRVADADARPGDYVMFNWDGRTDTGWADHIGLVEWSDINGSGYFGTIEGNTGNSAGGEVARVTRYNFTNYFTAFYRPHYDGQPTPTPAPVPQPQGIPDIRYRACTQKQGWLPEMINRTDTGGSGDTYAGDNSPMTYLAVDMPGRYRVCSQKQGWLGWITRYDPNDLENGCAGDGSPIKYVECDYETQDPNATGWLRIRYAVANVGENFLPEMEDNYDTGGSGDTAAGNGGNVSAFYAYLIKA